MGEALQSSPPIRPGVALIRETRPGPVPPPVMETGRGNLTRLSLDSRLRLKRAFDVVVSTALLTFLLPAMALIALAIRIDSRGPIFFSQLRVGQNRRRRRRFHRGPERRRQDQCGREFRILKFRTMHADAAAYAASPTEPTDPRITAIGSFLRRTCLDELPQLINVLRGEMSLVGPRPEMPFIVDGYDDIQRRRLDSKPGITGLWQLRGLRDRAIHETIGWDLHYVRHWSLTLDLAIVLETAVFAVRARNH